MSLYLGNFNQAAYQERINRITGTRDGRPLIKLGWCPDNFRWMPYRLGTDEPFGYTFPSFCIGRDAEGFLSSPERWALWQRVEWPQYGTLWEAARYKKHDGYIWDLKGPCPDEKYVELRCHSYHDGKCCNCIGAECECVAHCWGKYQEPDESLLEWIRKVWWESTHDPDVKPLADGRFFEATEAQRKIASERRTAIEESQQPTAFDREAIDLFLRQPHSIALTPKKVPHLSKPFAKEIERAQQAFETFHKNLPFKEIA